MLLQYWIKSPAHPLVTVWKAYLKDDASLLNEVAIASPAYVFPYRTETLSALEWALSKNSNWKFKYYLALNYAAVQRDAEAMKLFDACGQEPDYAPFYLTRANLEDQKMRRGSCQIYRVLRSLLRMTGAHIIS